MAGVTLAGCFSGAEAAPYGQTFSQMPHFTLVFWQVFWSTTAIMGSIFHFGLDSIVAALDAAALP
jgi:hypothetical protein